MHKNIFFFTNISRQSHRNSTKDWRNITGQRCSSQWLMVCLWATLVTYQTYPSHPIIHILRQSCTKVWSDWQVEFSGSWYVFTYLIMSKINPSSSYQYSQIVLHKRVKGLKCESQGLMVCLYLTFMASKNISIMSSHPYSHTSLPNSYELYITPFCPPIYSHRQSYTKEWRDWEEEVEGWWNVSLCHA